jgi:snRNA-activating protein complex subunit 3
MVTQTHVLRKAYAQFCAPHANTETFRSECIFRNCEYTPFSFLPVSYHLCIKKLTRDSTSSLSASTHEALLTISVYVRVSWNQSYLSRASQHLLLASQTLGDLFETIPCTSNELPNEIIEDDHIIGYDNSELPNSSGCAMCIEGLVYGDGQSEEDYAEYLPLSPFFRHDLGLINNPSKLMKLVDNMPVQKRPPIKKSATFLHETPFTSISLRLHYPYWLLHQGNCEHFLVVDEIRSVRHTFLIH